MEGRRKTGKDRVVGWMASEWLCCLTVNVVESTIAHKSVAKKRNSAAMRMIG